MNKHYKLLTNSPEDRLEAKKYIGKELFFKDGGTYVLDKVLSSNHKEVYREEDGSTWEKIFVPIETPERDYFDYFSREEARKYIHQKVEYWGGSGTKWYIGTLRHIRDDCEKSLCFGIEDPELPMRPGAAFIRPIRKETVNLTVEELVAYYEEQNDCVVEVKHD